jgi:hypothetical protein
MKVWRIIRGLHVLHHEKKESLRGSTPERDVSLFGSGEEFSGK